MRVAAAAMPVMATRAGIVLLGIECWQSRCFCFANVSYPDLDVQTEYIAKVHESSFPTICLPNGNVVIFYRASICEDGLGSRNSVCPSVRPSVRLSVTRVDCDKTK